MKIAKSCSKLNVFSELCINARIAIAGILCSIEFGDVSDFEFQLRRRDGEIRIALQSTFVTRDDSGSSGAYQGFILDITDRKQAEIEIRRRNRELLALNAIAELLRQSATLDEVLAGALAKVTELFAADVASVYLLDESSRTLEARCRRGLRMKGRTARPYPSMFAASLSIS